MRLLKTEKNRPGNFKKPAEGSIGLNVGVYKGSGVVNR